MPHKSRWSIDIPTQSLPSYVFESPTADLEDKPIIIDAEWPEVHLTHRSYREWAKQLAAGLRKKGVQPGDRILLYSGNTVFFPVIIMGTVMAGGIFTGANPSYVPRELAYQLKDSGAKFLITAEGSLDTALEAASSLKFPRDHIFVMGDGSEMFKSQQPKASRGLQHWSTLLAPASEGSKFAWKEFNSRKEMNATAVLNYSSGTTGLPKGVEISHMNYISNCVQTDYIARLDPEYEEKVGRAKVLSFLPLYHAYGQTHHSVSSVRKGIPVYLMRKFDFIKMLQWIQKYRITGLPLVPPVAVALAKRKEVRDYDISTVEGAGVGAAPLSSESINDFEKAFGRRFQLKAGYGMSGTLILIPK